MFRSYRSRWQPNQCFNPPPTDNRTAMITHFLRICIILICVFCLSGAGVGHVSGTEVGPIGILFLSLAMLITLIMMGLYAGSETALVSVDKGFIDKSATEGNERAKIVRMLTGSHDRMLGMTLVGTNIMHVATSQLGLILVLTIISYSEQTRTFLNNLANITTISVKSVLLTVGFNTDFKWQISLAWVATIITTFLILVFAEILPKTLFRNQANSLALQYAPYLRPTFSSDCDCGHAITTFVNSAYWPESTKR